MNSKEHGPDIMFQGVWRHGRKFEATQNCLCNVLMNTVYAVHTSSFGFFLDNSHPVLTKGDMEKNPSFTVDLL